MTYSKSITNKLDQVKETISVIKYNVKKIIHSDTKKENANQAHWVMIKRTSLTIHQVGAETQSEVIEISSEIVAERATGLGKDGSTKLEEAFNSK
jgi:DNA-binding ferritin-like protein